MCHLVARVWEELSVLLLLGEAVEEDAGVVLPTQVLQQAQAQAQARGQAMG